MPSPEVSRALLLRAERSELLNATQQLVEEYGGRLAAGVVIACVVRCRDELERAGVRNGLAPATVTQARELLSSVA